MTDDVPFEREPALFQRWRHAVRTDTPTLDALTLAAYAEGHLGEAAAEQVEAALSADPALIDDWLTARDAAAPETASADFLRRAMAAVPAAQDATILPFRTPVRRSPATFRAVIGWGAIAASLLMVGVVGFGIGIETQQAMEGPTGAVSVDLLDASDNLG